ncbi:S8 family peptidase, partial [Actinophytocola sp.]|uniref:S8 family peptidase n=1 Tax=Actinophytocola sp. TaxID=1872138 RepID=UPI00389AA10D
MIRRGARSGLLAAVLAAGVVVPAAAAAPPAVAGTPPGPAVTLVTGDEVVFGGMDGVVVHPAKGREHVSFYKRKDVDGDIHVVPEDAVTPLARGTLDPRLFDVTELVRDRYDDASRRTLPLIVDYKGRTPRAAGARVTRELPAMSAAAVSVERSGTFWATARNAEHVWLDGPVQASLDHSVPQIGAPAAWAAGYTGAGTTVAVLDTGIDATHPDLADAVVGARNFTDSDTDDDRFGHGTHVASIITGSGAASGGKYRGVAPDAKLLNGKVLDDSGGGLESWIIAGMDWAAHSGAEVVNMSLGSQFPSDGTDPMSQAVDQLTADTGTLFVIAAGNTGGEVTSPGAADAALTVGAVDRDDQLAGFSSRRRHGGGIKPDITAPGVDIVAAKAKNGTIGEPAADGYVRLSGTSMATPHVAGAAAILAGEHPDWTAAQLKPALTGSAKPTAGVSVLDQGAGRVDVARAVTATVSATTASLDEGTAQWPHDDDQPIAKTLTYTNSGAEPVTLDLAAAVTGPDGAAAPQGMFTFTPARLTVPAGGQASATVTTDTTVDAADGRYEGAVVATGDGQSVRTPVAVTREVESYDVTVHAVNRDGAPTDMYWFEFVDVNHRAGYGDYDPSGTVVTRVPKGEFFLDGLVQSEIGGGRYDAAEFVEPSLVVDGDTEVVLDERQAKPVGFHVDRPNAKVGAARWRYQMRTAWGAVETTAYLQDFTTALFRPSTTSAPGRFTFSAEARMGEWNGTSFDGSPYLYSVRHTDDGGVPRTLDWTFPDSGLAKVRSEHAAATPGVVGYRENFLVVPLPGALTEYYTPNVPWDGQFIEMVDPATFDFVSVVDQIRERSFPRGRTTTERWNVGVFNPALPNGSSGPWYFAARQGDQVRFALPLFTDQGQGRAGSANADGTTTLLRDGVVVGEFPGAGVGLFTVDPGQARYTLRTSADRSSYAALSTQVSAEWTFTSAHVPGEEPALLPLLAVRFAPDLDGHNAAPAGRRFTIPVYVQRNGSDEVGPVGTPTVDVSYDDGKTWRAAKVDRTRGGWRAVVDHPTGAVFVSLRSSISDPDGN